MSVVVEVSQDVALWLEKRAKSRGVDVSTIASNILSRAANDPSETGFEADLASLANGHDDLPALPEDAFSREAIYANR
jgi:hypothetical protein